MTVRHSRGAYEVRTLSLERAVAQLPPHSFIITDENVSRAWGHSVSGQIPTLVLPAGEATKSIGYLSRCLEWLAENAATRQATVVAFGGGVIGDLAGFAAAAYMRGVPLVQVPTTLLAQVDSSVGGKVGVDLPQGKNLAGAFHPPAAVYLCPETLSTLSERDFRNGAAEVWKYGATLDGDLLTVLEDRPMSAGDERLPSVVERCIALKAQVVEADEFETSGLRAVLNFGHTVGHAVERLTGYGPILHGEAVAIGMVAEARLGESLGLTPNGTADRLRRGLDRQGLPTELLPLDLQQLIQSMRSDKKAEPGALAFALLTGLGECKLIKNVPEDKVLAILQNL